MSELSKFQSPILEGLKVNGYQVPSPIQVSALPYTLAGLDVLVQSKSGTGKTLVYVLSALSSIDVESNELQGLLIAPTREIAVQGAQTMLEIGGHLSKLKASTFIGGMSVEEDKLKLKKCHMAFGSPGRVKQLIEEGVMNVSQLKVFILDEADKLCEKSFKEDLSWIMRTLPEIHQTLALSATFPNSLENTLISK
ncbi:DDX20 [Lepeophtheirus salmonis]|uniref:DDX20 n=1 Tax=Lepeophtheirus salmonis TaxID=72036 RepID=A0A7R8H0B4_LEPSM|nr:DDX20 [Lepeophtheirus salmonis]CAF2765873.1 DDX20 [Lepeophtheirus salmonis]